MGRLLALDSWKPGMRYCAIVLSGVPVFVTFMAVNGLLDVRIAHRMLGLTCALTLSVGLMAASLATYLTGYQASMMSIAVTLPMLLIMAVLRAAASFIL